MVERPAQSDCRFSFLLATMKPRPPADASGIFFRVTEFRERADCSHRITHNVGFEASLRLENHEATPPPD